MASRKTHDIVATVGTYKDRNGEEKKRYLKCGIVLTDDSDGRMSIKLDAVPVTPEWSGWLNCYEPRDDEKGGRSQGGGDNSGGNPRADRQREIDELAGDDGAPF